jgi:hypothetical protein
MYAQATNVFYQARAIGGQQPEAWSSSALFRSCLAKGRRGQFASMLTRRSRCLLRLAEVEAQLKIHDRCDAGVQTVPIEQIRGSRGRAHDFDRSFRPLQSHTRARWQGIALAHQQGVALPPVALVQIGDIYFVLDGHHRISVARAYGQKDIEARVTAWEVTGHLPWEAFSETQTFSHVGKFSGITCLAGRLRRTCAQIGKRIRRNLQEMLGEAWAALGAQFSRDTKELRWT